MKTNKRFGYISLNSSSKEKCFRQSCRENPNTHFYDQHLYFKFMPFMRKCGKIWYSTTRRAIDSNRVHTHFMLDTLSYKHSIRICNTYCFSTVTMVARTHLNVTL